MTEHSLRQRTNGFMSKHLDSIGITVAVLLLSTAVVPAAQSADTVSAPRLIRIVR